MSFLPFFSQSLSALMATPESSRHSLIPSFLYSSSSKKSLVLEKMVASTSHANGGAPKGFLVPSPSEPGKIEMYSPAFYAACTAGGILSCGLTHMAVTPLDLVKCNMQV